MAGPKRTFEIKVVAPVAEQIVSQPEIIEEVKPIEEQVEEVFKDPMMDHPTVGNLVIQVDAKKVEASVVRKEIAERAAIILQMTQDMSDKQAEFNKIIMAMRADIKVLENDQFETRRHLKQIEREIENLQREIQLQLDRLRRSASFISASTRFDQHTAGLYWREWALSHQIDGAKILANCKRGILGDKMGLGKTLTSIIWADMLEAKKILIVVPSDIVQNFAREINHWAPHRPVWPFYKMNKVERSAHALVMPYIDELVIVTNYENLRAPDVVDMLKDGLIDTIILDEAHTIKNNKSQAFESIRSITLQANCCPRCSGRTKSMELDRHHYTTVCCNVTECGWDIRSGGNYKPKDARSVKNVLCMTGTPVLNKPQDLFPMLNLILPDIFDDLYEFLHLYCEQDPYTQYWVWKPGSLNMLKVHLDSRYVVRDRHDAGVTLPKQSIIEHYISHEEIKEGYPDQWRVITQLTKHAQILLTSGQKLATTTALALITRKRQANTYPGGIDLKDSEGNTVFSISDEVTESIKVDRAVAMIKEWVENGDRVVLFSQFTAPLRAIQRKLGNRCAVLDGSTHQTVREIIKVDFDRTTCDQPGYETNYDVVLCNFKTGGVGLNFTAATHTIILDEEWSPGKNEQAYGRTDRIGQTEESSIHIIRVESSIDTWMAKLIEHKQNVVSGFSDATHDITQQMLDALNNGEMI